MRFGSFIKILRPVNLVITFLSVWTGALISIGKIEVENFTDILLAAIAAALINGAGNVINDYFDVETDVVNNKNRPLVKGEISKTAALVYYVVLNAIALGIIYSVSEWMFAIAVFVTVLLFVYSWLLKKLALLGNMTVAFITGLVFIYAGVLGPHWWMDFIPFVFAFHINLIREILKDLEDLAGDVAADIFTLPYLIEEKATKRVLAVLTVLLIVETIIPYKYLDYGTSYLIIVLLGVDLPLSYFIVLLFREVPDYPLIHKLLKTSMFAGLAAILAGSL